MTTAPFSGDELSPNELKLIADAAQYMENPSLLMQMANAVGKPLEFVVKAIDKIAPNRVDEAVRAALGAALKFAVYTIPAGSESDGIVIGENINDVGSTTGFWHKISVAVTGSAGGLFGIAGLAVELPITTTIMFRSIASIAKEFGEDVNDLESRLQCLSVFCLGGAGKSDDAMESTYLAARFGLQKMFAQTARVVAGLSAEELATMIQKGSAPAVVNLIAKIASQFDITVTQKVLVQAIPVVGAATGATINVAFMEHFNRVARFHFGIRSLERKFGPDLIHATYLDSARRCKQEMRR